jgi:hypothetical protein
MAYTQDHRPIRDDSRWDPSRPLEPQMPMKAEHASPTTSLLILVGIVAVALFGSWLFATHDFGTPIAANQAMPGPPLVIAPAPSTTGAAPAR